MLWCVPPSLKIYWLHGFFCIFWHSIHELSVPKWSESFIVTVYSSYNRNKVKTVETQCILKQLVNKIILVCCSQFTLALKKELFSSTNFHLGKMKELTVCHHRTCSCKVCTVTLKVFIADRGCTLLNSWFDIKKWLSINMLITCEICLWCWHVFSLKLPYWNLPPILLQPVYLTEAGLINLVNIPKSLIMWCQLKGQNK